MYDVVIVGAGPGGIFTAYELLEKRPNLSMVVCLKSEGCCLCKQTYNSRKKLSAPQNRGADFI